MKIKKNHCLILSESKKIDFLWDNFCHRKDAYTLMTWNKRQKRGNYYERVYEPLTKELVTKHIAGELTLGVFPTRIEDQTVKFACWDFDHGGKEAENKCFRAASRRGKPLIEASGGDSDRKHFWVLFDEPRPVSEVSAWFDRRFWRGIDFFPEKRVVLNDFYFELPVKLPLGVHRVTGKRSYFKHKNI